MGWIEDSIEEFKKLPPAGKIAVGGAALGVAILAYAHYRSNQNSVGSGSAGSVTGAFPGVVGVPSSTDSAGGVWTFPPISSGSTGGAGSPSGGRPILPPRPVIRELIPIRSPFIPIPDVFPQNTIATPPYQRIAEAHVFSSAGLPIDERVAQAQ